MTFPATILPIKVELLVGSTWTDISTYTYVRDGISIYRGRQDEGSPVNPQTCALTLDNRDGRFSPRNPTGAYYGSIGRNSQIRVSITNTAGWLQVTQVTGTTSPVTYVSTTDKAQLDITGDIDIRFDAYLDSWRDSMELVTKYKDSTNQRSFWFGLSATGKLFMITSVDGTATIVSGSSQAVPITSGRLAVRCTVDVNNGAGGNTVTFYVSDSLAGTWTQLGTAVVNAGTTSIFNSTTPVYILDSPDSTTFGSIIHGRVYGAKILNGIAGSVAASPDFTAQTAGAASFADAVGNTWTLTGSVALTNDDTRFIGEVAVWPTKWDPSGKDVYASITASGILRRLAQGSNLGSALYRGSVRDANIVAYWPMEDGSSSTVFSSAISGGKDIQIISVGTVLASNTDFVCSDPLPLIGSSALRGAVPTYALVADSGVQFLLNIPSGGLGATSSIISVGTTGTLATIELMYGVGGTLFMRFTDRDGAAIATTAPVAFLMDDALTLVKLGFTNVGADTNWSINVYYTTSDAGGTTSGTQAGFKIGRVSGVTLNPAGAAAYNNVVAGHLAVTKSSSFPWDTTKQVHAWVGELACARIERLCDEESVTFCPVGPNNAGSSVALGPQLSGTLLTLLQEAAAADLGVLHEARDFLALRYRPRRALGSQQSGLVLDYAQNQMDSLDPVEDDQITRNDVTVSRIGGGSARAELVTGALATAIPPNGVGRYDDSVSISLQTDDPLPDQANLRMRLGTVDQPRYPSLPLSLESSHLVALTDDVAAVELGDRISITNPPAWTDQLQIDQLVQGYTEELNVYRRGMIANLSPAVLYDIGVYDDFYGDDRYASGNCLLNEALDTTETGIDVLAASNAERWSSTAVPYKIVIGGEVMTVTAVTGAVAAQTLTVTRSVNGVVKSHSSGIAVELLTRSFYTL